MKLLMFFKRNWWIFLIVIMLVVGRMFLGTAIVKGTSMTNTLQEHDFLLIHKTKDINRGDIVAIWSSDLQEYLCKRVIGLPNDRVEIIGNKVKVNNEVLEEPYIKEEIWGSTDRISVDVPEGYVYVLGDNRNGSLDSRKFGCIAEEQIYGVSLIDLTKSIGITGRTIIIVFIGLWVLYFILLFFGKRKNLQEDELKENTDNE